MLSLLTLHLRWWPRQEAQSRPPLQAGPARMRFAQFPGLSPPRRRSPTPPAGRSVNSATGDLRRPWPSPSSTPAASGAPSRRPGRRRSPSATAGWHFTQLQDRGEGVAERSWRRAMPSAGHAARMASRCRRTARRCRTSVRPSHRPASGRMVCRSAATSPLSGRKSTYRAVRISRATSVGDQAAWVVDAFSTLASTHAAMNQAEQKLRGQQ
jgi:hypothetical protein